MSDFTNKIVKAIADHTIGKIKLMEVCGTHTMSIARSGLKTVLPEWITLLSGPGCPVCVTDQRTIDYAIALARQKNVMIATFGDMVRIPGTTSSLEPYAPKIVYSALDALTLAQEHKNRDIVFIGIGFETTSPTIAATILAAEKKQLHNFFILPAFKLIPPALDFISRSPRVDVQGYILPGHVSTIIGTKPYLFLAEKYNMPGCVTGFEPIDILHGILNLVRQIAHNRPEISIEYTKVVKPEGNIKALEILYSVFEPGPAHWRGIGKINKSGLVLRGPYKKYDVMKKYDIKLPKSVIPKGCICGKILLGVCQPLDCKLFGSKCTPLTPIGPCMVSSEGACAAQYKYGIIRQKKVSSGRKETNKKRTKNS